jgi:nucleoside-diphosphate-sugar epimerase
MRRVPQPGKARALLGFEARVPLDEGLIKTIEWQRSEYVALQAKMATPSGRRR